MNSSSSYHLHDHIATAMVCKDDDSQATLTISIKNPGATFSFMDHTYFINGPLALEQILDLGYEIVNACRKLMPPSDPVPEHEYVPYTINDAIDQERAMDALDLAKQQGYDPDLDGIDPALADQHL